MKRVALVAAHFVPSNLAAVHRARLWAQHLGEFGWRPIIVAAHWKYYEEPIEPELAALLSEDLQIIRTDAFRTKPIRWIGDIGIRAFPWHYQALVRLARKGELDFLHITIPSNFSALLGRLVKQKTALPYGIDYIDPWVHKFPGSDRPVTKAWISARLANWLEPWAVKEASLITGINRRYYEGMLRRNPGVADKAVLAEMPYGGAEEDHQFIRDHPRPTPLLDAHVGKFNLLYAGAMLPNARVVADRLFEALSLLRKQQPNLSAHFHLHFIGTGKSPNDPKGFNLRADIDRYDLSSCVSEYPQRLPYLDVLAHLHAASAILVLGSTEPHYSPSKIFQSILARRPVFALLHEESTAISVLRDANAGSVMTLSGSRLPLASDVCSHLRRFIFNNHYCETAVRWDVMERQSARQSARLLAEALDKALAKTRG